MSDKEWKNKDYLKVGNASYSRTKAYHEHFNYLDGSDRFLLVPPQPKYKLAMIGTGLMGQGHIYSAFVEGNSVTAGLYDTHEGSIQTAVQMCNKLNSPAVPKVYTSLEEAVFDDEIDGFVISTPNYTHAEILLEVMKANKPIYLEKPMTTSVADAARIVRKVQETGAAVQVGLQYRHKAIYVEAIEETLNRNSIGEVKTISIREHRIPFLDKVGQWNKFSQYSGGTLVEKCCHYFDLFNLFAQSKPVRVFAVGSQAASYEKFEYRGRKSDILDTAFVTVEYENGIKAVFDLCMFVPLFFEELVLCGDRGRIRAFEQQDYLYDDGLCTGFEMYRGEAHAVRKSEPRYQGIIRTLGHSGADFFSQAAFVDLLSGDASHSPTVEEGYWSVVVGAAAEASVKEGKPIIVDEFIREQKAEI